MSNTEARAADADAARGDAAWFCTRTRQKTPWGVTGGALGPQVVPRGRPGLGVRERGAAPGLPGKAVPQLTGRWPDKGRGRADRVAMWPGSDRQAEGAHGLGFSLRRRRWGGRVDRLHEGGRGPGRRAVTVSLLSD